MTLRRPVQEEVLQSGSFFIEKNPLKAVYGEDCLVLNIYRPADIEPSTPIMIWIHGGGFQAGSGMSVYTNATHLAKVRFKLMLVS